MLKKEKLQKCISYLHRLSFSAYRKGYINNQQVIKIKDVVEILKEIDAKMPVENENEK